MPLRNHRNKPLMRHGGIRGLILFVLRYKKMSDNQNLPRVPWPPPEERMVVPPLRLVGLGCSIF